MSNRSLSFATRSALGGLLLAGLAGCGQNQKTFLAERRAEAVGYRIEHFERERLIFVHHPNGEKDGVELAAERGQLLPVVGLSGLSEGDPLEQGGGMQAVR